MHTLTRCLLSALLLSSCCWANPIHEAAKRNDCQTALKILRQDPSQLNARDKEHGNTPLHWAAYRGHQKMAELLILRGAKVDATNAEGYTPLRDAAYKDHQPVVDLLVEHGANPKARDFKYQGTVLHWAAQGGCWSPLISLVNHKHLPPDPEDSRGLYPADWAMEANHPNEAAQLLFDMLEFDHVDQMRRFLRRYPQMVDARRRPGESTLLCQASSAAMAELLLKFGANRDARVDGDGEIGRKNETPLFQQACNPPVLEVLLRHGANVNSLTCGETPLQRASLCCQPEAVSTLLKWGADPNLNSPLFEVCIGQVLARRGVTDQRMIATAKLLITAGARLDKKAKGLTPEAFARQNHNVALANYLASQSRRRK